MRIICDYLPIPIYYIYLTKEINNKKKQLHLFIY